MANVAHMDLGFLLFVGLTTAFAKGSAALNKEAIRENGLEALQLDTLSTRPTVELSIPSRAIKSADAVCPDCEASKPRRRQRRCTCYTYKDKECVYYCHLDIIWINTPERTVPYGMSSYRSPQRMRRSPGGPPTDPRAAWFPRCACTSQSDPECGRFCTAR
ncbi:endothelin-3 isoform X2 [Paramormyrops kingsleyae]|uniref:Endothelin-3 n=1 Tax=Paramormyrops kingsleyae TaxID=1676925 RepID=A0A3B3RR23_9TELE|nr:endothelin-3 isoform X1 [Paramormyrops kingsleyae]XP_023693368.1 endothelin-3 isoform X2 [Paramormyrops kingsleyae]